MKIIRDLDSASDSLRGGAVAIGNFDGVHLGHARIVERLVAKAREVGGPAVVFTFDPHPVRILRPQESPPPLTWTERKAELLAALSVDAVVAYPTDRELLELSAEEFFERIVRQHLDARALVEGPNFYFGHNRAGTVEVLAQLAREAGIQLEVVAPYELDGDYVSSSRIRRLIAAGDVQSAARMLTQPYRIRGLVTHGAGRGGKIGFPTANVEAVDTLLPAQGVYAGRAWLSTSSGSATPWPAAINIGPNPTFAEHLLKVEVHLIDFHDTLYGEPLEVDFLQRLRDICPFPSVTALTDQLARDVDEARAIAAEAS